MLVEKLLYGLGINNSIEGYWLLVAKVKGRRRLILKRFMVKCKRY